MPLITLHHKISPHVAGKYEEMCAAKVQLAQANKELNLEQQQLRERLELVESLLFDQYKGTEGAGAPLSRVSTGSSASTSPRNAQRAREYGMC